MSAAGAMVRPEEIMIAAIARMLAGLRHVAVGAASPIPGSAALLARRLSGGRLRVSLLGQEDPPAFTDGARELFDCAGQGRIDAFFLSGAQIDGRANVNLVSIGDPDRPKARLPGSFGSAYLYFVVPRVILFREEHTPRTLVERVDYISAPGISPPNVYRPGGPHALVTGRGVFAFDRARERFRLTSIHPGHDLKTIARETGFAFNVADDLIETPPPPDDWLALIRGAVKADIAAVYPAFAAGPAMD